MVASTVSTSVSTGAAQQLGKAHLLKYPFNMRSGSQSQREPWLSEAYNTLRANGMLVYALEPVPTLESLRVQMRGSDEDEIKKALKKLTEDYTIGITWVFHFFRAAP